MIKLRIVSDHDPRPPFANISSGVEFHCNLGERKRSLHVRRLSQWTSEAGIQRIETENGMPNEIEQTEENRQPRERKTQLTVNLTDTKRNRRRGVAFSRPTQFSCPTDRSRHRRICVTVSKRMFSVRTDRKNCAGR